MAEGNLADLAYYSHRRKSPHLWAWAFIRGCLLWLKPWGGSREVAGLQARDSEGKICIWATSIYPVAPSMELGTR